MFNHQKIEKKWQKIWEKEKIYNAKDFSKKPKFYGLIEFPYPSGKGMHMGHLRSNTAMDIICRKRRMEGYNVLYPIGWDAFGLPTENYAIKSGIHPKLVTKQNTDIFRKQLKSFGFSFDWSREINTTDPKYYKWTQWIFLQLYKHGLAYKKKMPINWCPSCKIGLANEEVIGEACERCGTQTTQKEKEQWILKITKYADKLLEGLKSVDYLERIRVQQENWIGKSEGAEIEFPIILNKNTNFVILHGYTGLPNKNFIPWLKKQLEGQGYKVQAPELPNTKNPKEKEQVNYVLENCRIDENTILIGHSLGGVVAIKVLQKFNRPVAGLVLVAPAVNPHFRTGEERPFWKTFKWDFGYNQIKKLALTRIILSDLQEKQRIAYLEFLGKKLDAKLITGIAVREHFCAAEEPLILENILQKIKVFTTRPDTLFGATYLVLAPEHQLLKNNNLGIKNYEEVKKYIRKSISKSEEERTAAVKNKTGVELKGIKAINPANKKEVPVFVADYVLGSYGTGAIMAVPAHDERDFEFAKKFKLPIIKVINPVLMSVANPAAKADAAVSELAIAGLWEGDGEMMNSGKFNGMNSEKAKWEIMKFAGGKKETQYHLRDWIFSRQHYWGEPIPIVFCDKCGEVPVPEKDLPVKLPEVKNYKPTDTGESPLAAIKNWVNVKCLKCGGPAKRETDTMPNWAGSSWYFLRYIDPKNNKKLADFKKLKYWAPVDWYNGGMEHTTLHLLYSRFWNKFLYDIGAIPESEPYKKRTSHGMILGQSGEKMSKSRGNVVEPDFLIKQFGADSVRLYEMFMGPFDQAIVWDHNGIAGTTRFLSRVLGINENRNFKRGVKNLKLARLISQTIKKVGEDIEKMNFNTAVASLMIFANEANTEKEIPLEIWEKFLIILAPFAPHVSEELWSGLKSDSDNGRSKFKSIHQEHWPKYDPKLINEENFELIIQINGKVRDKIPVPAGISRKEAENIAFASEKVKMWLKEGKVEKVIFVPNKLINVVVN